jgi:hypothetical protein
MMVVEETRGNPGTDSACTVCRTTPPTENHEANRFTFSEMKRLSFQRRSERSARNWAGVCFRYNLKTAPMYSW